MTMLDSKNFSTDISSSQSIDEYVESVSNPLVKQVLNQVQSEGSGNVSAGSAFGEANGPGAG